VSAHNSGYGIAGFVQHGGAYLWNRSHDNAEPGLYLGDSPHADYVIAHNSVYRNQYGVNAIYLLPVNLYGPGDNLDLETSHVIPALIRKMVEAQEHGVPEVVLWGDGSPTREFLYVEDCAEGIWLAAQRYDGAEPVNLGTGDEISIRELAELTAELTGYDGEIVRDSTKPNGQPRRQLDVSRAEQLFGFRASTPFRAGLERTIEWYRSQRPAQTAAVE